MPSGSDGQGGAPPLEGGGMVSNQLAMLVPNFDPSTDDVTVWSGKVELLLNTWPKDKLNELATRLILGCKGSMFLKLQLNRSSILTGSEKGIQRLVELVGGSFGQVPLERKFELAEKALFKCQQKMDESSDSYLSRCDVVWAELLARNMKLEELQAFIMLRGSKLAAEDKKRVIVESGGETAGVLEMKKVTAAVRMLGSGFFQDMSGQKRDRTQKIYDQSAFAMEDVEEHPDAETFMTYEEVMDDEGLETLAMDFHDEDAALILQFEDALMETIQADAELSVFYTSYQDARKRLADRQKSRGFWPVKRNFEKGGKKGAGKGKKGKQSLAQRISNSYCRICYKRGHWKDECPERNKTGGSSSASQSSTMAPTSFVTVEDVPEEMQHLPFEPSMPSIFDECHCNFGETVGRNHIVSEIGLNKIDIPRIKDKLRWGLHRRLRYVKPPDEPERSKGIESKTPPKVTSITKTPNSSSVEVCDSYFASTGTTGVVDLGASQTVIGSNQVSELLSKLPDSVRQQVKRTHCNLVFRFGNHQTLPSRHALLLPLQGSWFQIAVVEGNTPFLLSSNFLRKTIQAVIDTEQGTVWSKVLGKDLTVTINHKNLFLLDINQLWEDRNPNVNLATSHSCAQSDHIGLETKKVVSRNDRKQSEGSQLHSPMHQPISSEEHNVKSKGFTPKDKPGWIKTEINQVPLGPKSSSRAADSRNSCSPSNVHGGPENESIPEPPEQGGSGTRSREDDAGATGQGEDRVRDKDDWSEIREGLPGHSMGSVVRRSLRNVDQNGPSQVCAICGDEAGQGREDGSKPKGSEGICFTSSRIPTEENGVREVLDQRTGGRRSVGGRDASHYTAGSSGRGSGVHAPRESSTEQSLSQHGVSHGGDHRPPQEPSGQDRTVSEANRVKMESILFAHKHIVEANVDDHFEFITDHEAQSYTQECKRIINKMWQELGVVVQQEQLFPKSRKTTDVLEVMCSGNSEITKKVINLGGRATRFGLGEGDLSTSSGRQKLFQILVRENPKDVWFSPECAPWCKWNQFNASKSLALCEKVLSDRWNNLWQLCLAVVLFRYQSSLGRHFHIEQPVGSDMYKVPCMQEVLSSLSWCKFDLCRLGSLTDPQSGLPIRKRLLVCTSSQALHRFLNGKFCHKDHHHQPIAGSTLWNQQRMALSKFTEHYPQKFARQIAKVILGNTQGEVPTYVSEAEHPTKKRRLGEKTSAATIERMFPNISWQTALRLADRTAPRVGILVIEEGELVNMVQKLCPKHDIKHLVLCRGTDRYTGPSKRVHKGEAPLRLRSCIRRRFEDIQVDEDWEPWEKLTYKGLRRKGTAARVSLTVFASARIDSPSQNPAALPARPSSADVPIPAIHERPEMIESQAKRSCVEKNPPSSLDSPEREPQQNSEPESEMKVGDKRLVIDLASKHHGPMFQQLSQEERQWLLKLHRNLGHPGSIKLQEYCRQLECEPRIIKAIDHLRCSTCLEASQPSIARPSAIHAAGDFGDNISMDGFTWTNQQGSQFHVYHFVDQSTGYQTAVCSPGRSSEMAIRALVQGWISWAGAPGQLCMDAATEFNSEMFLGFLQKHNIKGRVIATDAHWQNSRAERHGGILQEILKRMDIEEAITTYDQLETAIAFATHTKNQWSRYRGFPPEMLVFGKQRLNAASNISDLTLPSHGLAAAETPDGLRFRDELSVRERARRAFAKVDNCQVMRRALLQRTRPKREEYPKGTWVMIWRKRGESIGNWVGPMQVVIQENHQIVWVSMGSKLFRIAPEHVRPLSAIEEAENKHLNIVSHQKDLIQGVTQFQDLIVAPHDLTVEGLESEQNVNNPPGVSEIPSAQPQTEAEPQTSVGDHPISQQPDQEPSVQSVPSETVPAEQSTSPDLPEPQEVPIPDDNSEWFVQDEAEVFTCSVDQGWQFEIDITQQHVNQWRQEETPHEMAFLVSAARKQRSEVKMIELDSTDRALFEKAKGNEVDSWISTETIARILRHQIPRENIMKCRWILTWKPIDPDEHKVSGSKTHPHHKPKARLVVLGFQDPQVDSIPRDSPTLSKLSRMLLLQFAASRQWKIGSFDVKTAFLRGQSRDNRILGIEPPKELKEKLRLQDNEVLQLLKGAYGRVDAPYLWFMELKQSLEHLGFIQAPFDPCCFVLHGENASGQPSTEGMIGIHVDDGLCCGSPKFHAKLKQLEQKFPFGSKKETSFVFTGLQITQQDDGAIWVDQTQYVKEIPPITLEKNRRSNPDDIVTEKERQSLRGLIGSLQYAAVNTRPDICNKLSLLQTQINRAKVQTLLDANKLLHESKVNSSVTLKIQPIKIDDVRYIAFSDASFASEKCPDSYQGMMIMAAHRNIGENKVSKVNPIVWHSKKIQKVAVSTLSAEAMALAGTTDMLSWVRLYWAWLKDIHLDWRNADETLMSLPPAFSALPEEALSEAGWTPPNEVKQLSQSISQDSGILTTDCKSLYDLVSRTAPPACQEFRTLLQAKLIKEHLKNGIQIRWVPSGAQIADCLTKSMDSIMLRECLRIGAYCLHDESEILRARSDAKTRIRWLHDQSNKDQHQSQGF